MAKQVAPKRGRPRVRPEELVGFRLDVTPGEADEVRAAAAGRGESVSTYTRRVVVREARKDNRRKK
jgi:hypothetical protein